MPLVQFLIGGTQKSGTSALAHYLDMHPEVRLPLGKEAHVFDNPELDDEDLSAQRINAKYAAHLQPEDACLHGDATPIYWFLPKLVQRIARYNPAMKWIILLRDPVDRAISQYYMERGRGQEHLPLWAALLAEPWRLRGRLDDLSADSPLRRHSYCARGRYTQQLDSLYANFPREQVLVLRSMDLRKDPRRCMERTYDFLGLAVPEHPPTYALIFEGPETRSRHLFTRWVLRQVFRNELATLRSRHDIHFDE
ncbi:MAG: sulfotransferase [Arenimonas sp.]